MRDGGLRGRGARWTLVTLLLVLCLGAASLATLGATGHLPGGPLGDREATPSADPTPGATASWTAPPAAAVLDPATHAGPAGPTAEIVPSRRLDRILDNPALGPVPGAVVLDAATGDPLFARDGGRAAVPASTAKLVTCAAALLSLGADTRLTTRVVAGAGPGEVVVVGGGDGTLASRRVGDQGNLRVATLTALASRTARALKADGPGRVVVRVDDSLFTGPAVSPDWEPGYVRAGVVSPVSALSVDAGRVRPGAGARERDPALAVGQDFAQLLRARGLTVDKSVSRTTAPQAATELAAVRSPPLRDLVEHTLATSDNDLAEVLGRLAAHGSGRPASFTGVTATVAAAMDDLSVPSTGLHLLDGSGLARGSRLAPDTLVELLRTAVDDPRLGPLISGLPVASFSGSLAGRFSAGRTAAGAGLVRAKTGTLTGVSALAGLADDGTGRPVVFAVLSDRVPPAATLQAREAIDRFATTLAR